MRTHFLALPIFTAIRTAPLLPAVVFPETALG